VLWVVGLWLLVSLPLGLLIGGMCGLNRFESEELPLSGELLSGDEPSISDELPTTTARAADLAALGAAGIPA
jgi:hypothetical protein